MGSREGYYARGPLFRRDTTEAARNAKIIIPAVAGSGAWIGPGAGPALR